MRLATFNILHGRSLDDGRVDLERLAKACASLDADVLGLQEVDRHQRRSDGRDLTAVVADAVGADHWRFQPALVGVPGGAWQVAMDDVEPGHPSYGVALVSRLPVVSWHTIRLPAARVRAPMRVPGTRRVTWVADEPRVALGARVEAPFGAVTVVTTHLSFLPGWNAWQFRHLLREVTALPGPYVLLGDLNLMGRLPALLSGWRSLVSAGTYPAPLPRTQIDHILASGPLPAVRDAGAVGLPVSDHRALVVELEEAE